MSYRKGFAAVTACAAMTCAGMAYAGELAPASENLSLNPVYLQDATAAAPVTRKPLMSLLNSAGLAAPLESNNITIGGFVEGSWTHDFEGNTGNINTGRVFDVESDDLTLNQVDLFVDKAVTADPSKFDIGGHIEWIYGGDARFIHSNGLFDHYGFNDGPDEQFDPVQLYVDANIPIGNGLIVTFGKFVTLLGYETINPTTNPLYSHTYEFGYAIPFTNTGLMAKYAINKNWSVTGAVVRGWDQALEDNNGDTVSFMGQVAYTSDKFDFFINGITGPERADNDSDYRSVLDLVGVYRASDQLTLVGNADLGYEASGSADANDATWWGFAGYGLYKFNDMFTGVGRAEIFSDNSGARGLGTTVYEATLGLNITPFPNSEFGQGLKFRPEVRYDYSQDAIFNGGGNNNQFTVAGDLIYAF